MTRLLMLLLAVPVGCDTGASAGEHNDALECVDISPDNSLEPLAVGNTWSYQLFRQGELQDTLVQVVESRFVHPDVPDPSFVVARSTLSASSPPIRRWIWSSSSSGLRQVGAITDPPGAVRDTVLYPFLYLPGSAEVGDSVYSYTPALNEATGLYEKSDSALYVLVEMGETVSPAGVFPTLTWRLRYKPLPDIAPINRFRHFAKGVGVVSWKEWGAFDEPVETPRFELRLFDYCLREPS